MRFARRLISLSLCLATLAACTGESDGLLIGVGNAPAPKASPTPDDPNTNGEVENSGATPTPTPSVSLVPVGFNDKTVLKIERPGALALDGGDNLYVASRPLAPTDSSKPHLLTVATRFGTVKTSAALATQPVRFAFQGTTCLFIDDLGVMTLDASLSVAAARQPFTTPKALAVSQPNFPPLVKAVSTTGKVFRLLEDGQQEEREFPGGLTPTAMAFDRQGHLWAAGGTTLAKLNRLAANAPIVVSITDLGTLTSLAMDSQEGVWVLGTQGLAYHDAAGVRQAGPFAVGGDRVFLRSSYLGVANFSTGRLTRLKTDGSANPGASGLSVVTLPGGLTGAALDSSGNMWVSSLSQSLVAQTKF